MSKSQVSNYRVLAVVALVAAAGFGFALSHSGAIGDEPNKEVNPTTLRYAEQLSEAFHNASEIAMPCVVTIHSKIKAQPVRGRGPAGEGQGENPFKGTPFEDYFKGRGTDLFHQNPQPREGVGSGVIIDSQGIVLTNNHVVAGADEVTVHLADGREFKAEDIKTDEHTDLAVIRIHGAGSLPAAKLGDSDQMRIGDWVIAIGSPFELDQTVSAGIISGSGRELSSIRRAKFLQTDAAINPGNSGGPLVNLKGEVVGINTAIATNNGSFNGIGFAIPANLAKWVTGQLIAQGSVQRAYLGVGISELTPDLAEKLGTKGTGVAVTMVHPDTPASAAGFEAGDVITSFGGKAVSNPRELQELVERVPLNSKQDVEVTRGGKSTTLSVMPLALPKDALESDQPSGAHSQPSAEPSSHAVDDMGISVSDLTAEQAKQHSLAEGGVIITSVDPGKPGYAAGLREGMVVLKVDRTAVKDVESFKAAMKDQSVKSKVLLHLQVRPGLNTFVVVKE